MYSSFGRIMLRILFIFCIILLVVNIFRHVAVNIFSHVNGFSGSNFGFDNLLSNLSSTESLQIKFDISSFQIGGNWGIVDGIRQFFNAFATILGVLIWLGTNLINLILFLAQFVRILLV